MDDEELEKRYEELENTLWIREEAINDGREHAIEIRNLPRLPSVRRTAFLLLDFVHRGNSQCCILRIAYIPCQ